MARGGAKRCSLKHSSGMIALRLIAPLAMRDENRERRKYLKEKRRYEEYLRQQQQQQRQQEEEREEQEAILPAASNMPTPPPDTTDGTTEKASSPRGVSSCLKKIARRLRKVASNLKPRNILRGRGRGRQEPTTAPLQPPRHMPHWQHERPKPTPAWMKSGTPAMSAYPEGYRPGAGRRRGRAESRSISPYRARGVTSAEARASLAARRREKAQGQDARTRVVNRVDMPEQYKQRSPY
ncbi:hypothetical protein VSDG_07769 [Cytospora chrysosperma]|uniref:Uncharacterized protein n=1 Tax=Cytospora chrysosperma TaxID=252740 RepID=A0A423VK11_CYTCH|nr:hypothetical protein VSDG_07769 [Valsa sordida]